MRLQHKVFTFALPSGDKPISRLLTSKVKVNEKETDILMSDLFHSIKKEKGNTIVGWSILEMLNDKGEIAINDKVYTISFQSAEETFVLVKVSDHPNFQLTDKETSEEEDKFIEQRIIDSVPVIEEASQQPGSADSASQEAAGTQSIPIYENEDYESEKADLAKEGYVEYNTNPKSNFRLLVQEETLPETEKDEYDKIAVIEIEEDDFATLDRKDYKLELNSEDKTFTYSLVGVENLVEN